MKSEEKQLAPPETVSRNARNHLSDEQWRSLLEKTLKQANLFNDAYMNLFFEDAIPCVQLMVDKIIGDGYTVEPAPQKGHWLLSVEHERTVADDLKTIWSQICVRFLSRNSRIRRWKLAGWPIAADLRRIHDTVFLRVSGYRNRKWIPSSRLSPVSNALGRESATPCRFLVYTN